MAFDTPTRNRLNKFVGDARTLLTEEFTNQFKKDYGLDPDTGEVADLDRLTQLDDAGLQTAIILRDTLAHYRANLPKKQKSENKDNAPLIERIIREQAFTILNRLSAIRMAEARDLVIESIAKGVQSKGFQLYQHVVGSSLGETGAAYQQFLYSLFDEFAVDLPVLFDRFSPQGRLFPRETVLLQLLSEINHAEIDSLWAEDETIGWIYQYFNSKEERKAMRDAVNGGAPRNSRELAVRNQFFTPRYVVEFLTDNTLGRIWYEMRKGETRLKDECQYLVRRPNEIFEEYKPEAQASESPGCIAEPENSKPETDLTQEELLNQPVHIPHRPLKDPREIRMLDPACGSMHFGLYAFDLYLKIYDEYWDLIAQSPDTENRKLKTENQPPLTDLYPDKPTFLRDVPRLIIEHNIHGIDIDPRAVQIAGLSLWLRAQRAWKVQGIGAGDRPQVTRSNVVCAEPMPGDPQQLKAFCQELQPAIAQMVTAIFEEMRLAGEAGSLLKIEKEIKTLVAAAKEQWQQQPKETQMQLFGGAEVVKEQQLEFDLSGITDQQFFEQAEETIYEALRKYASETSEGGFRRKLFAGDAEKGFAFIELCQKRFDTILMNPPFGDPTRKVFDHLEDSKLHSHCKRDILTAFVEIPASRLTQGGRLAAITKREPLFTSSYKKWRHKNFFTDTCIDLFADLGGGVLDNAMVETVAYAISNKTTPFVASSNPNPNCDSTLRYVRRDTLQGIPNSPIALNVSDGVLRAFDNLKAINPGHGDTAQGAGTTDDFRFCRFWFEAPPDNIQRFRDDSLASNDLWVPYVKGEPTTPFFGDIPLVVKWGRDGAEVKEYNRMRYGSASRHICNEKLYGTEGLVFPRRTSGFRPRHMPGNCIFSVAGQSIFPLAKPTTMLSFLYHPLVDSLIRPMLGRADMDAQYEVGIVAKIPLPDVSAHEELSETVMPLLNYWHEVFSMREESTCFAGFDVSTFSSDLPRQNADWQNKSEAFQLQFDSLNEQVEAIFTDAIGQRITDLRDPIPMTYKLEDSETALRVVSFLVGTVLGRFKQDSTTPSSDPLTHCLFPSVIQSDLGSQVEFLATDPSQPLGRHLRNEIDESTLQWICHSLGIPQDEFDAWVEKNYFEHHFSAYSGMGRYAPIYWPISTESGSYTLWFYYHRLTDQTLYKAVNDFVESKLKETLRQLGDLRAINDRSGAQEKELAQLTELDSELEQFKADLLEIAAFWKPNLNDGVQITAAPLWKFFRLTKWRNKLKKTWEELEAGEYDWAHLSLSIWPDRVVREKCTTDRSIAIAHDLEEQLWEEREIKKTSKTGRVTTKMQWMPKELSSSELDAIVESVGSG